MATAKKKASGESYGPFEEYKEILLESGGVYGLEAGDVLTVEDGVVSRVRDGEVVPAGGSEGEDAAESDA